MFVKTQRQVVSFVFIPYIYMEWRKRLSSKLHLEDVRALATEIQEKGGDADKEMLFALLSDADSKVAGNAAWVFSHFRSDQRRWLYGKQQILIDMVMRTKNPTLLRLILSLLLRLPFTEDTLRTDFLDFCLLHITQTSAPVAIRSLCLYLSYEQCRFFPELTKELRAILSILESEALLPGLRTAKRNVLHQLKQNH